MKILCISLLILTAGMTHAQETPDDLVMPRPLKFVLTALFPELKPPMRSMAWISVNDTMNLRELDKKGNIIAEYGYSRNKKGSSTTTYTYTNGVKSQLISTDRSAISTVNYKYTAAGNYAEWSKATKYLDKNVVATNSDIKWVLEYDDKNNLVRKYRVDAANTKMLNTVYVYDSINRLTEMLTNNNQSRSVFEYDAKGNLISRTQSVNGTVTSADRYTYDNEGKVLAHSNNHYTADFTYEGDTPVKCIFTSKSGKEKIDFSYKDGLLSEINIQRDDFMACSPLFYVSSDYFQLSESYNFKIEILYDSRKNTREVKYYINGEYKYSQKFAIDYY